MLNTFYSEKKGTEQQELNRNSNPIPDLVPIQHFGETNSIHFREKRKKTRILLRKGIENFSVPLENVALLYSINKVVHAVDLTGKKYFADGNLTQIMGELDEKLFFRANRQNIISLHFIKSFKVYEKVKLKIDLLPDDLNNKHFIIISQETAPAFKKWISAA